MSAAQASSNPQAARPPISANFEQASGYLRHQRKAFTGLAEREQMRGESFGSINTGITQLHANRAFEKVQNANQQIDEIKKMQRAWNTWATTPVPVGMTPQQFKKSLLGG